jgi:hypothetical protein
MICSSDDRASEAGLRTQFNKWHDTEPGDLEYHQGTFYELSTGTKAGRSLPRMLSRCQFLLPCTREQCSAPFAVTLELSGPLRDLLKWMITGLAPAIAEPYPLFIKQIGPAGGHRIAGSVHCAPPNFLESGASAGVTSRSHHGHDSEF